MGVDLNRIGFGISSGSSRNGFGNIVSFPATGGGGCPADGTFNQWIYDIEYPIAEGGASVYVTEASVDKPTQIADVQEVSDGSCGFYYDWSSATGIEYKAYGTELYLISNTEAVNYSINSTDYQIGTASYGCVSDGAGGYVTTTYNAQYYNYGTYIVTLSGQDLQLEVPNGSMNYVVAGTCDYNYYCDGAGSVYNTQSSLSWFPFGTFLTNYNGYDYYSDSVGGYYS
jgi:hypothetical protein